MNRQLQPTKWLYPATTIVLAFVCLGAGTSGVVTGPPDASTARTTVAAVVKALTEGDVDALATLTVGDAPHQAWVQGGAAQTRAVRGLEKALNAKFGNGWGKTDAGQDLRDTLDGLLEDDLRDDLKGAKIGTIRGDTVLAVVDDAKPDDLQPQLVRADGRWRLDLASISEYLDLRETAGFVAVAKAADELARNVSAGKFDTLEDAAAAVDERLTEADHAAPAAPTTKPTSGPAADKATAGKP